MKRAAHIVIMSLSVLLILAVPFIPHHHHGGVECLAMVQCAQDGAYNDHHTSHHADGESAESSSCIASHLLSLRAGIGLQHIHGTSHHVTIAALTGGGSIVADSLCAVTTPCAYRNFYHSPSGKGFHSLRAPPQEETHTCIIAV